MNWAIQTFELTKHFPASTSWKNIFRPSILATPAVDQVSLNVRKGELFGLLGPNGAGKTTLIKMLCTLILPTSGSAELFGYRLDKEEEIKKRIGLVTSDERSFYWRLSGRQNLEFFSHLYGLNRNRSVDRINTTLEKVGLREVADNNFQTYSTGIRQRLAIARALLNEPRILFLDEPSRGLDPNATLRLHDLILKMCQEQGMTIFLTTHHLEEAEKLCQRIAIMDRGRILACGETEQVRASLDTGHQYRIRVSDLNSDLQNSLSAIREDLDLTEVDDHSSRSGKIIRLPNAADTTTINKVIDILRDNKIDIIDVIKHEMSLSEIFSHYVSADSRYSRKQQDRSESKDSLDIAKPPNLASRGDFSFSGILVPHVTFAFLKRDWRLETSYRVSFLLQFVGIFFNVVMFYFISELFGKAADPFLTPYGSDYFSFVLIGIAFFGYLGVGISAFSQKIRSAQTTGTLEAMIATPTRYSTIIFSSALWDFLHTTFRMVVYLAIGILFMGVRFPNPNYLSALVVLILSIFAFSSLGIIAASFIMVLKRGDPVTWLISSVSSLLGGVYYPVAILPLGLQWLAYLVPITYSLHGMRLALLQGATLAELTTEVIALALFCIVLVPVSLVTFIFSVRRAKIDGSLTQY